MATDTPVKFRREVVSVTEEISNRGYIILDYPALAQTLDLQIQYNNYLAEIGSYIVVKITNDNVESFPGSVVGDHVLSWRSIDVDGDGLQNVILPGQVLDIKFVELDWNPETVIEEDTTDFISWDVLEETPSSSSSSS